MSWQHYHPDYLPYMLAREHKFADWPDVMYERWPLDDTVHVVRLALQKESTCIYIKFDEDEYDP